MKVTIECEDNVEFINIEFVRQGQSTTVRGGTIKTAPGVSLTSHSHKAENFEGAPDEPVAAYKPQGKQAVVKDDYFESTEGEEGNQREAKIDKGMANFTV
jgi:hypothetical protein